MWALVLQLVDKYWKPFSVFLGGLWLSYKSKKEARLEARAESLEETAAVIHELNGKEKLNESIEEANLRKSAAAIRDELRRDSAPGTNTN